MDRSDADMRSGSIGDGWDADEACQGGGGGRGGEE